MDKRDGLPVDSAVVALDDEVLTGSAADEFRLLAAADGALDLTDQNDSVSVTVRGSCPFTLVTAAQRPSSSAVVLLEALSVEPDDGIA